MPNHETNQPTRISIESQELTKEMRQSYLDYAMSVIVSRALPDVRDGLKPVHRRILYSMNEIGLRSNAKHRKSALVVGDVLGKFHPHGDQAVYDALVRMAQPFSMRYRLANGQGNFGSLDGDSAAAMRYTEVKMASIAEELLADIDKETVAFVPNYDGTRNEPSVLPGKLPHLLLNGTLGIAVGMATNIPTHNLSEVCDATIAVLEDKDIDIDGLIEIIKGPDFPTGGIIYGLDDIKQAYATGKGSILMRAKATIEEDKSGKQQIIISEIPYQVNKADCITKIADLVKNKKIEGISDLRDESDRKEGVRIVVDLKNSAYPKKILNQLFDLTPLQTSFHINMVALVDGIQPRLLTLKDVLVEYIKHRQNVITLATKYDLKMAQDREHILLGLKIALDDIDRIISTIRESKTRDDAKVNLVKEFKLSEKQADAILEMRLAALAGLERQKVLDELASIQKLIKDLEGILADPRKIDQIIKKQLTELKEKFGDARRTKIVSQKIGQFKIEDLVANEQVVVSLTFGGYIKRMPADTFKSQSRGGKGIVGMETKEEDQVMHLATCFTHDEILFFTSTGRVFSTRVFEIPQGSRQSKGKPMVNVVNLAPQEKITAMLTLATGEKTGFYLMATKKGTVKRVAVSAFNNIRSSGIIAIKLKDDELQFVKYTSGEDKALIVTRSGKGIYFNEKDARAMGRAAAGVRGIRIKPEDSVVALEIVANPDKDTCLLTILEQGYGKRTSIVKHMRVQGRGGKGLRVSKVTAKTGRVISAHVLSVDTGDLLLVSDKGQLIRIPLKSVKKLGRDTMGVMLMRLKAKDKVASVAYVEKVEATLTPVGNEVKVQEEKPVKTEKKTNDKPKNIEVKKEPKKEKPTPPAAPPIKKTNFNQSVEKDSSPNYWGKQK